MRHLPPTIGGIGGGCIAETLDMDGAEVAFCNEEERRALLEPLQNCDLESLVDTGWPSELENVEDETTFEAAVDVVEVGRESGAGTAFVGCSNDWNKKYKINQLSHYDNICDVLWKKGPLYRS